MGVDWGRPTLWGEREHAHLRLTTALDPQPRRRRPYGGRGLAFPDRATHAKRLRSQASDLLERHSRRTAILGVNPDLVVVIELNRSASLVQDELERSALQVLGTTERNVLAAFSSNPELTKFLSRLAQYEQGPPPGRATARYETLFDSIEQVRELRPSDVLDDDVQDAAHQPAQLLRLDFQCWCPENEAEARRRYVDTRQAIQATGGTVVDSSFRFTAGLSLIRADVPPGAVSELAMVDRVRRISLLPRPLLTTPEVTTASVADLPPVLAPPADSPIVAVIDSGIRSGHPLLAPAVVAAIPAGAHIPDGTDEHGHGTLVASLALYGSLEVKLRDRTPLQAAGRLVSVRVLDESNTFPDVYLWVEHLKSAIELAAQHGARVVNLSLGDSRHPYRPPAPDAVAAMVDELARELDLVMVISAGNFSPVDYVDDPDIISKYPTWLLDHGLAGLLPPAHAALALTTGALVADHGQGTRQGKDSVDRVPVGKPGSPSPLTRVGPGIEDMIKPELTAPGGTCGYDLGHKRLVDLPEGRVVGAAAMPPDRLLATDAGTSFAAPLVSHAALRVLGRYPSLSANAVRALLLATTERVDPIVDGPTQGTRRDANLRLTGYGRAQPQQAECSEDHRAVLLAEQTLLVDQVHFYAVPIPDAFFQTGPKLISLGLAFSPRVRATRLTYLSNRMSVYAYRGTSIDDIRVKYATHLDDDEPPEGLEGFRCKELQPSDQKRLLGANQACAHVWSRAWSDQYRGQLVIVVRNTNRWAPSDDQQSYALAVTLRTGVHMEPPLYAQLRAELPLLIEIEPEIEL